jgi:hypothetical protein
VVCLVPVYPNLPMSHVRVYDETASLARIYYKGAGHTAHVYFERESFGL